MADFKANILKTLTSKRTIRVIVRTRYLLLMDSLSIIFAFSLALLVRYESLPLALDLLQTHGYILILSFLITLASSWKFGLYSRMWRYASLQEVIQVIKTTTVSSLLLVGINFLILPQLNLAPIVSRAVILLDWVFILGFLSVTRLLLRIGINWLTAHNKRVLGRLAPKNRVLIMGAGDVGSMVIRMIVDNPELGYVPVAFADDDPIKQSKSVHGIPVLGNRADIPNLVHKHRINEVVVAMPTAPQEAIDDVCRICKLAKIPVRVVPDLRDILAGSLSIEQLRQWRPTNGHPTQPIRRAKMSPTFQNMLVTGGAGFIGSNFVHYMLETHPDYRIIVLDRLSYAGNLDNLKDLKQKYGEKYVFVRGDICDINQVSEVMHKYEIDSIVNFAAETHVDRSLMQPEDFLKTNIFGTYQLLEAARQFKLLRYHQVSTDEVYGQIFRGSFSEEDPLETRNPYSASKAAADLLVHAYCVSFDVPATITRGSNNIGPYQYPEKAVPLFITNALEDKPLPVYGDGLYVRDYQYVLDHCRGIDFVMHHGVVGEIYNLGGGNEVAATDLAKRILDKLGKPHSLIHLVRDRDGQDRRYSLNCAKIKSLGWSPEWTYEKALDATIEWYIQHEWWWRKLKSDDYWEYYEKQYRERLDKAVQMALLD